MVPVPPTFCGSTPGGSAITAVVLAVGSPFGADRIAWQAVRLLERAELGSHVRIHSLDRPGPALLECMRGAEVAVIVDALLGGEPGQVHLLDPGRLMESGGAFSSHGLGVAEALALGRALGDLPPRVVVIGIAVGEDPEQPPERVDWNALVTAVKDAIRGGTRS